MFFFGGGEGEEGAAKVSQNLPKVSPKFWQNFMSSNFKKTKTLGTCIGRLVNNLRE